MSTDKKAPSQPKPAAGKTDDKPLLYADLLKLAKKNAVALFELGKNAVNLEQRVNDAKDVFTKCQKFAGKVMAAMQVAHISDRSAKRIEQSMDFDEYHEQKCGAKPKGRVQSLGRCFNRFVVAGFITEAVYDAQTEDALCAANETYSALEAKHKGTGTDVKTTEEFKKVVAALNGPGEAAKTIKAVKKEVKGADAKEGAEATDADDTIRISKLTPEIALQLWDRIVGQGHANVCLLTLPDHIPGMSDEAQKSLVLALDTVQERVYTAVGGAADIWLAEKPATLESGIVHLKAGQPVPVPTPAAA